ncbi:hypothetical protein LOTGIDRAFT_230844 [Lottia gigantea]|uniref:Uncharacterized protein n=1 Tax=Lottia gigantea TaxID=225164 RepID=V4CDC5_LOTGI|nr:hypothetical protein LOTGIDRAFT_230844 [Lottia gigantea]ESO99889.1 hypothetical protein LOTGIDRAFT_230844 [Lottia gigantea]
MTSTISFVYLKENRQASKIWKVEILSAGPTVVICSFCYNLVVLIIKAVLVVLSVILVIVHFSRKEAKKGGNVYWVINVILILIGLVCLVLAIIQILYVESVIACPDLTLCLDKAGHDAAIAFIVLGFIAAIVCIVLFVIRIKQRDQSKETNETEMKPNSEKEVNGTPRPLPVPKNS